MTYESKSDLEKECHSQSLSQYIDNALEWHLTPEGYEPWFKLYRRHLSASPELIDILPILEYEARNGPFGAGHKSYMALAPILKFTERFGTLPSIELTREILSHAASIS